MDGNLAELRDISLTYQTFTKYRLYEQFPKMRFSQAIHIMMDKHVIQSAQNFINSLKKLINFSGEVITAKTFLSSYLITNFQSEVLSVGEQAEIEKFIYDESVQLVKDTQELNIKDKRLILEYIPKLNKFKHTFNNWKKKDLESQLEIYSDMYHNYKHKIEEVQQSLNGHNTMSENTTINISQDYLENLVRMRDKIYQQIEKLVGKEEAVNTIDRFKRVERNYEESVYNAIKKTMRKAFWDKFKEDIEGEPPNYSQVKGIVSDMRGFFHKIYHTHEDKKKYVDEYLDENFISQLVNNNVLPPEKVLGLCKFCLDRLKELDAAAFDIVVRNFYQQIDSLVINGIEQNIELYRETLINCLAYLLERLESLSELTAEIRTINANKK
jgi:hypothetical protein